MASSPPFAMGIGKIIFSSILAKYAILEKASHPSPHLKYETLVASDHTTRVGCCQRLLANLSQVDQDVCCLLTAKTLKCEVGHVGFVAVSGPFGEHFVKFSQILGKVLRLLG